MKIHGNIFVIGPKRETEIGLLDVEIILNPVDSDIESVFPLVPMMTHQYSAFVFSEPPLVHQYTPMVWETPTHEYEEVTNSTSNIPIHVYEEAHSTNTSDIPIHIYEEVTV